MKNKKKIIIWILLIIILMELICTTVLIINISKKVNKQNDVVEKTQISPIDKTTEEQVSDEHLTDEYKEYLELEDNEKESLQVVPRKEKVEPEELENIIENQTEKIIPKYFNLSDIIEINIENQQSFGLCWAFSSLKTLETFLELKTGEEYNLSEIKVDYITSNLMYGYRNVHDGGSFDVFEDYLLRTGPKKQSEGEYRDYTKEEYEKFIVEDDITRVTDTIKFPALNKDEANSEEIEKFRDTVKTHIMENGGLYTVIKSPENTNYYCSDNCFANHAVTIIGWDDNYKKENFISDTNKIPEHDGAYIAINSWGEEWGNNGYFYISYDDMTVDRELSGIISTSLEDAIDLNTIESKTIKEEIKKEWGYTYIDNHLTNLVRKKITYLDLSNKNITDSDLKSLDIFTNLYFINLSNNNIKDPSYLSNLKRLYGLDLSDNKIIDVSQLSSDKLTTLNLNNNEQVQGFENLTQLTNLELENTKIENINIKDLINLNYINLNNNFLKEIELPNNVEYLSLENNLIESLDGIKGIETLYVLNLAHNYIKNINITDNMKIYNLNLDSNNIKNIKTDKKIDYLNLSNNNIEDIAIINNQNILYVNLSNNAISDLKTLDNNYLEEIDLSNNKNIENYEPLKNIKVIILQNNNIDDLNILDTLEQVVYLDLSNNNISDITPLNKLKMLKNLILDNNKDIKGTLENNINFLSLKDCGLEKFDITKLNNLENINISNNHMDIKTLFESKSKNLYISLDNATIGIDTINYLIENKEILSNENKYLNLYEPNIYINIKEFPYNIENFTWLNIDDDYTISNGIIEDNLVLPIDNTYPVELKTKQLLDYYIINPTIIFTLDL